jgi:hypothetical protein
MDTYLIIRWRMLAPHAVCYSMNSESRSNESRGAFALYTSVGRSSIPLYFDTIVNGQSLSLSKSKVVNIPLQLGSKELSLGDNPGQQYHGKAPKDPSKRTRPTKVGRKHFPSSSRSCSTN